MAFSQQHYDNFKEVNVAEIVNRQLINTKVIQCIKSFFIMEYLSVLKTML